MRDAGGVGRDRDEWFRLVPVHLAGDYLLLGWVPSAEAPGAHGARVQMWRRCCCREGDPPEPREGREARGAGRVAAEEHDPAMDAALEEDRRLRPRLCHGEGVALAELAGVQGEEVRPVEPGEEGREVEPAQRGEPPPGRPGQRL